MVTAAAAIAHTAHNAVAQLKMRRIGLWLFILSESFLFAAMLSARYINLGLEKPHELNQFLGLVLTGVLLVSSLTAFRGEVFAEAGNLSGMSKSLLITIAFAAIFLVGVGIEWFEAFQAFPPQKGFGTMFFTLTGLHGFHVLTGAIALFVARRHALKHGVNSSYWAVEGTVKYWHFVDLAWVFIYPTLYLAG